MKTIYTFLICSVVFVTDAYSQSLTWSSEIVVANGNPYGYIRPRIAVASGNIPVVMWGGGAGSEPLYAARWNGTGFNTPATVTPNNVDPFIDTWAGADMAASGNNVFVVFKRQMEMMNNIFIVKSADGGVTWSDTTRVDGMNGPYTRFPSVAVSSAGNPAVMFMTFDTSWGNPAYAVTNSTDGGQTFPMPVTVSGLGSSEVCDCCPGYMTIQGNNQVASWRRNNNNLRDMWAGVSTNSGMSFTTGLDVDNTNWMIGSCPSTGPAPLLKNDSLFTVFMSEASGDPRIIFNSHNILTQQDGYTAMLTPSLSGSSSQNYPFIAGNGDTLVMVWQQNTSGNIDTYYSWSVTGSAGLFANVNMLNSSMAGQQQNPHVAFSNGTFHFVFTDLNSGNVKYKSATLAPNSISEPAGAGMLRVYPNPANGNVSLDLPAISFDHASIKLVDVTGRIVETLTTNGEQRIQLRRQSPGIYFVEVTGENNAVYKACVCFY
ncbi:MAG: hypothetical protein FD123_3338 [Bacteroidetes bacterium]|nr:MAG: hypothetical protein FD123_3338 [Bacteroidota bacterium]